MRPLANLRHRKGQIQIGEMVLVLVVAFIIGIALLTFFMQRGASESTRASAEQERLMHAVVAKQVSAIPSIRYSLAGREDLSVIDAERAKEFATLIRDPAFRPVYRERYAGYSAIIEPVYPARSAYDAPGVMQPAPFDTINLFDFTDNATARRNSVPFRIPVLLFDPLSQRSSFAVLTVTQVSP